MLKDILVAAAAVALSTTAAVAVPQNISGTGALGAFTGAFTYTVFDSSSAQISITIENVSPAPNGGYVTAFAFNNPGNQIGGVTLSSAPANFGLLFGDNAVDASPNGNFDIGASTGGGYQGGGMPQDGLGVGDLGVFVFDLTGAGLDLLTEDSFISELSVPPGIGDGAEALVVRFRGFEDGGSDKVPGVFVPIPEIEVPAPAAMLLFGLGVLALGTRRR